ncbi:MAG: hypothetical protein Q8922_04785 [Bacteroidota bacterium]|nr:hypothetical protein [Bacteroidota bacterium]MDP4231979.1 hypothetical protein [Bacteroidota bacterium]MDP4241314.1 hypothetical protein [Bacteroidota bacterium]MDP4287235.1 hypothetical protein [Bacteroidota bacterium]
MKHNSNAVALLIATLLLLDSSLSSLRAQTRNLSASTPRTISYQGVLRMADGSPATDNDYQVTIRLYSDEAGTQEVWRDSYVTRTTGGVFTIALGSGSIPLPEAPMLDRPLWLGAQVGDGEEMRPLAPLSATAYALNVADKSISESKISADYIKSVTLNGQTVSGNGKNLNIQTGDGMVATVDPATNTILLKGSSASLDGSKGGEVQGNTTISGSLTVTGSTFLGSATSPTNVYGVLNASKDILPVGDNTQSLGNPTHRWKDLNLGGGSLTMIDGSTQTQLECFGGTATFTVTDGSTTASPLTLDPYGMTTTDLQSGAITSGLSVKIDGTSNPRTIQSDAQLIIYVDPTLDGGTNPPGATGGPLTVYAGPGGGGAVPGNGGNLTLASGVSGGGSAANGSIYLKTGGTSGTPQITIDPTIGVTINTNATFSTATFNTSLFSPTIYGGTSAGSNLSLLTTNNSAAPSGTITLGGSTGAGTTTFATMSATAIGIPNGQSILASGSTGTTPASGAGTRLEWIPAKAAFRAGQVSGTAWDDASVGAWSISAGSDNVASGESSTAFGNQSSATGEISLAVGDNAMANGSNSAAIGAYVTASGNNSTALGFQTTAGGSSSTAMGNGSTANGNYSVAIGANNTASGNYSTALGSNASTNGQANSLVYGDGSTSTSNDAANQFMARASGGYKLFDDASATPSLTLSGTNLGITGDIKTSGGDFKTGSTTRIASTGDATLQATTTTTLDVVGTANINSAGSASTHIGNATGTTTITGALTTHGAADINTTAADGATTIGNASNTTDLHASAATMNTASGDGTTSIGYRTHTLTVAGNTAINTASNDGTTTIGNNTQPTTTTLQGITVLPYEEESTASTGGVHLATFTYGTVLVLKEGGDWDNTQDTKVVLPPGTNGQIVWVYNNLNDADGTANLNIYQSDGTTQVGTSIPNSSGVGSYAQFIYLMNGWH